MDSFDTDKMFGRAIHALEAEIETVRERPSSDVLFNGVLQPQAAGMDKQADYKFETDQPSIRFAEKIVARDGQKEWEVTPVAYEKNEIILRFPEKGDAQLSEIQVEWENDFVLQRTLSELERLESAGKSVLDRIRLLFEPGSEPVPHDSELQDDGLRNTAQRTAIEKSMRNRTMFIWGPPGTGKTATLGYIIANYLRQGKKVLFVSNTNRAVDVGLLSALGAIREIGLEIEPDSLTRFGDPALDEGPVTEVMFEQQIEKSLLRRRAEASEWAGLLGRQKEVMDAIEKRLQDGKAPTEKQKMDIDLIDQKIRKEGGRERLEEKMDDLSYINERSELKRRRLVATTMAKVCTSELFHDLDFDAVVIDEGSMANLPYLMVMASKARWHRVIVGDPMQLPPIALTEDAEARDFLEKDIFTTVSGAGSTGALFAWHDNNPGFTCFFDTQYRLMPSLADVISTVFYEGRLKTAAVPAGLDKKPSDSRAYHLIDTSRYGPVLTQKSGERGFQPVNVVHKEIITRLIGNMLGKGIRPSEIGVMVPFRSSVYELKSHLYESSIRDIEVGTIHTFQGREKPYIIFDTVMSGEIRNGGTRHYSVRPLDEEKNGLSVPRLLNVAFSRSQKELMIVADMNHIGQVYGGKFLGRLLERMRQ